MTIEECIQASREMDRKARGSKLAFDQAERLLMAATRLAIAQTLAPVMALASLMADELRHDAT